MYKHILLPFNGSEPSLMAEKECLDFARSIGASVTVLHVLAHRRLPVEDADPAILVKDLEEAYDIEAKRSARSKLLEVEKRARAKGIQCSSVVVFGNEPYREIIKYAAAHRCDLVMMAARRRRIPRLFMPNGDADRVLFHSNIPTLVVR